MAQGRRQVTAVVVAAAAVAGGEKVAIAAFTSGRRSYWLDSTRVVFVE